MVLKRKEGAVEASKLDWMLFAIFIFYVHSICIAICRILSDSVGFAGFEFEEIRSKVQRPFYPNLIHCSCLTNTNMYQYPSYMPYEGCLTGTCNF